MASRCSGGELGEDEEDRDHRGALFRSEGYVSWGGPAFGVGRRSTPSVDPGDRKVCAQDQKEPFCVHVCPRGCSLHESGDRYCHAQKGKLVVDLTVEPEWITNLLSAGRRGRVSSRRARGVEEESRGSGARGGEGLGCKEEEGGRLKFEPRQQEEEKEKGQKEEAKEGEGRIRIKRKGEERRAASSSVFAEGSQGDLRRDWSGPSRESSSKGHSAGEEVLESQRQEEGDKQFNFVKEFKFELRRGGRAVGRPFCREQQGQEPVREIPGNPLLPVDDGNEGGPFDGGRRGCGPLGAAANSYAVLSRPTPEEGKRPSGSGVAYHLQLPGSSPSRTSISVRRHSMPEAEEHRSVPQRQPLVYKPEDGNPQCGPVRHSPKGGAGTCPKRILPRFPNQIPGFRTGGKERREGERQRWQEGRWQRRTWKLWKGWRRQAWERRPRKRRQEEGDLRALEGEREAEVQMAALFTSQGSGVEDISLDIGRVEAEAAGGCPFAVANDGHLSSCRGLKIGEALDSGAGHLLQLGEFRHRPNGRAPVESEEVERLGSEPVFKLAGSSRLSEETSGLKGLEKRPLSDLGHVILQRFLEVLPLRSSPMEGEKISGIFPLPTSRELLESHFDSLGEDDLSWLVSVCMGLNSLWGSFVFCNEKPSSLQLGFLEDLLKDVIRMKEVWGDLDEFDWKEFFRTRTVDYQGEEVKLAKRFKWSNIAPALPVEVGRVPLEDVCEKGAKYYVENVDLFVKPKEQWGPVSYPKVMVDDADWCEVCEGLVNAGVCVWLAREEVFCLGDGLLLNGLFGVSKDEIHNGVPTYRLIMNLIPFNNISQAITGDIATLPNWGMMSPYFIQPSEQLLISSEDVRCFFYIMSLPPCWYKYLAFNKVVPDQALPPHLKGQECYLAAKVLPMGFLNSVSLAQHVHRNMALASGKNLSGVSLPERELRKDRSFPTSPDNWRIYLDNFDLLERVEATQVASVEGSVAPSILALRQQYESWEVPRNVKKSVARSSRAEVQGAMIDGLAGLAYPRDQKLVKYVCAALKLCGGPGGKSTTDAGGLRWPGLCQHVSKIFAG